MNIEWNRINFKLPGLIKFKPGNLFTRFNTFIFKLEDFI